MTGDVLKPSDERIKTNIIPIASSSQLETVERLKLYEYELKHSIGPDGQPVRERGGKERRKERRGGKRGGVERRVEERDGVDWTRILLIIILLQFWLRSCKR